MSKSSEKGKKKYADTYKWPDDEVELLLTSPSNCISHRLYLFSTVERGTTTFRTAELKTDNTTLSSPRKIAVAMGTLMNSSSKKPKTDKVYITAKHVRRYGLPDVDTESSEEDESQPEGMILMTKMTSVTPEVHDDLGARYHNE
ncbi:hypothetical protein P5673_021579 [Acropora cervicornis]|uniref:Uncharacterized protein n=1 Tax=Acropora cervicornis TaxID=6130 RepID=A0AAD9V035_ACRCE|nr:hypothetical protein P5673_021579 [Acropora cervicornis]